VKNRFQNLPFKCNLQRYIEVDNVALVEQLIEHGTAARCTGSTVGLRTLESSWPMTHNL
jgi:hypothetical protein